VDLGRVADDLRVEEVRLEEGCYKIKLGNFQ
jgi:hypothetical protein